MGKWCLHASSFLIESSSKMLVTRTGIKAWMSSILGLWFPWPIYMFFEIRFDLGTLDSGERSLPFGLLVFFTWGKRMTSQFLSGGRNGLARFFPGERLAGGGGGKLTVTPEPPIYFILSLMQSHKLYEIEKKN